LRECRRNVCGESVSGQGKFPSKHHRTSYTLDPAFLKPEGDKFSYQAGNVESTAHGESVEGSNTGSMVTHHSVKAECKINKSGILLATALCNIHTVAKYHLDVVNLNYL